MLASAGTMSSGDGCFLNRLVVPTKASTRSRASIYRFALTNQSTDPSVLVFDMYHTWDRAD